MRHIRDGRLASVRWVCGVCTLGVRCLRAGRAASARPQHNPVPDRFKCSNTICYWSLVSAGQEVVATETELAALPKRQRQVVVLDIIILVGCTPHPQRTVTPPNARCAACAHWTCGICPLGVRCLCAVFIILWCWTCGVCAGCAVAMCSERAASAVLACGVCALCVHRMCAAR